MDEWKKGGLRYAKLKERIPQFLAPVHVQAFFVAVRRHGGRLRLVNPIALFQREYVIAVTNQGASVLRLRRPGVFSATVARVEYQGSVDGAGVQWRDGGLAINGVEYRPIAFHDEDAKEVGQLLGAGGLG